MQIPAYMYWSTPRDYFVWIRSTHPLHWKNDKQYRKKWTSILIFWCCKASADIQLQGCQCHWHPLPSLASQIVPVYSDGLQSRPPRKCGRSASNFFFASFWSSKCVPVNPERLQSRPPRKWGRSASSFFFASFWSSQCVPVYPEGLQSRPPRKWGRSAQKNAFFDPRQSTLKDCSLSRPPRKWGRSAKKFLPLFDPARARKMPVPLCPSLPWRTAL